MRTPGRSRGAEHSFSEVLNSRSGDVGRLPNGVARRTQPGGLGPDRYAGGSPWWARDSAAGWHEWTEVEDCAAAVRPYTWTAGRTRPSPDLAVETLVSTSARCHDVSALASLEHRAVAGLCRGPRSVAEVAALLSLPLAVARVLLADMAEIGLVVVHRTAGGSGEVPEFGFMERVLSGLRRL